MSNSFPFPETADIQLLLLKHPTEGIVPQQKGTKNFLGTPKREGDHLIITFPFSDAANEELTNITFGVDYTIEKGTVPLESPIDVGIDGSLSTVRGLPFVIRSLDNASAVSGAEPLSILPAIGEKDTWAIAYDSTTRRIIRSRDLKNKPIQIYKADAFYIRAAETKYTSGLASKGIRREEVPLNEIHLLAFCRGEKEGETVYLEYVCKPEFVPNKDPRRWQTPPSNARTVRFVEINLITRQILKEEASVA